MLAFKELAILFFMVVICINGSIRVTAFELFVILILYFILQGIHSIHEEIRKYFDKQ